MIHIKPLPGENNAEEKEKTAHFYCNFSLLHCLKLFTGTPLYNGSVKEIIYSACKEAEMYLKCAVVSCEYIIISSFKKCKINIITGWYNRGKYARYTLCIN